MERQSSALRNVTVANKPFQLRWAPLLHLLAKEEINTLDGNYVYSRRFLAIVATVQFLLKNAFAAFSAFTALDFNNNSPPFDMQIKPIMCFLVLHTGLLQLEPTLEEVGLFA